MQYWRPDQILGLARRLLGGFWGLFLGGLFISTPLSGPVFVVGFLATAAIVAIENAVVVGGLSALGAVLYSIGIPKDSVIAYESDIKADGFLVMARGSESEVERAKAILQESNSSRVDIHSGSVASIGAATTVHAVAQAG